MALKNALASLVRQVVLAPLGTLLVNIFERVDRRAGYKRYVAQHARFSFGLESPTRANREQVLRDGNNADALAWIICYDNSRRRRKMAWEKIQQMSYTEQPRAFGEADQQIQARIINWISLEAKDDNIRAEAKAHLPKEGPWSRP